MRVAEQQETALVVVRMGAMGASGLTARALAAAAWSSLARFELCAGEPFGIADSLRLSPCPLYDTQTPLAERMLDMVRQARAAAIGPAPNPVSDGARTWLLGPPPQLRPPLPPRWASSLGAERALMGGTGSWAHALVDLSAQLHAAPTGTQILLAAVDSCIGDAVLQQLHSAGLLSTEARAEGLVPGEAAAALALCTPATARAHGWLVLAEVAAASMATLELGPGAALLEAVRGALGPAGAPVHTLMWDIGAHERFVEAVAEAVMVLPEQLGQASLVRPFQQLGHLGAAFGPVAAVLAIEGCRAGLTRGSSTLICTLEPDGATAVRLHAPCNVQVMLADLPAATP